MPFKRASHLITASLLIFLFYITGCSRPEPSNTPKPKEATPPAEKTEQNSGEKKEEAKTEIKTETDLTSKYLISVEELKENIKEQKVQIIDVRSSEDYQKEHLPFAIHLDLDSLKKKSLDPTGLEDTEFWASAIGSLGIGQETGVVVYGEAAPNPARASWLFGYQGVKNIRILDGGWKLWKEQEGETTDQIPTVKPQEFKPEPQTDWVLTTKQVEDNLKQYKVIDARSEVEYVGKGGKGKRHGRIPGAVWLEWTDLLHEDGTYKTKEELLALFDERGLSPEDQNITHCQSGGRASVNFFAFRLAGYSNIKNYYCGWSEWSADDSLPIEKSESEEKKTEEEPTEKQS